jgi:endonuclease-3
MTKKQRAQFCVEQLKIKYPDAICSLNADNPFQLLVATRLSAQCTDARVNLVTPALFAAYPTPKAMAKASYEQIEDLIKSCGLYKTKAKSLVDMAQILCEKHGGQVPDNLQDLTELPGIGRKTANLIMGDVFKQPGSVVADTHLIRITNRIGLVTTKDPYGVEMALRKILPPEESNDFCHRIVHFGREICTARNPKCELCPIKENCKKIGV